jgi:putative salt-induced outer membrane protein YdiY
MRAFIPFSVLSSVFFAAASFAQTPAPTAPAPPPKPLTGNVSFGLALTSGNNDTSSVNASYEVVHDPRAKNVIRSSGLLLRGTTGGNLTAEQYALTGRDEYSFSKRTFAFGELRYLHDRFKDISYLLSPAVGAGYRFIDTAPTVLSALAGAGAVWERDTGRRLSTSGAVTAEQKLSHAFSKTATVTESVSGLWKTNDFADALYTFSAGLAVSIVSQAQLKVEVLDTYKNKPPSANVKKNDVALITGVVYKF